MLIGEMEVRKCANGYGCEKGIILFLCFYHETAYSKKYLHL
jgi:hypothetical protein